MKLLKKGDHIRITKPTLFGWKGSGIITQDQTPEDLLVFFEPDDGDKLNFYAGIDEVSLIRKRRKHVNRKKN